MTNKNNPNGLDESRGLFIYIVGSLVVVGSDLQYQNIVVLTRLERDHYAREGGPSRARTAVSQAQINRICIYYNT